MFRITRWMVPILALFVGVAACSESGSDPLEVVPEEAMLLSVSAQAEAHGTEPPMSAASVDLRVIDPEGAEIHSRTVLFTQTFPFVFGPIQVAVGSEPIEVGAVEVLVRGQVGEERPVLWSGRVAGATLEPGSEVSVSLTLYPGPLSNLDLSGVSVSGAPAQLGIGEAWALGVQGAGGAPAGWFWGSLDPSVATVSASGEVLGQGEGTARIIAAAGTRADTLELSVRPLVETVTVTPSEVPFASITEQVQLEVEVRDFRGELVDHLPVSWSSSDTAVVRVDAQGRAWARSNGTALAVASAGGASGSATVTVAQVPDRIQVAPAQISLVPGETAGVDVVVRDALGARVPGIVVELSVGDDGVVAIEGDARVRALSVGSAVVIAEAAGFSEEIPVAVVAGAAGQLNLLNGDGQAATAGSELSGAIRVQLLDASGFPIPDLPVSWTTPDGGEVVAGAAEPTDAEGRAEVRWRLGPAAGAQTLVATAAGLSLQVQAEARAGVPASIRILPAPTDFHSLGQTRDYEAMVEDIFGNATGDTVTWSFENGAILEVSNAAATRGRVTALTNGIDNLVASLGALSTSLGLEVQQVSHTVIVVPDTLELFEGATGALSAEVRDALGSAITGASVAWSSDDTPVASVDLDGGVTGVAEGETVVRAASGAAEGGAVVIVTPGGLQNGSFEIDAANGSSTIPGWSTYVEGSGNWFLNDGSDLPLSQFDWPMSTDNPGPTDGDFYVVVDQNGPTLAVLYQDITVPASGGVLRFDLALRNWHSSEIVHPTDPLNLALPNQHFRVDLVDPTGPLLDVGPGVLATVYQTVDGPTPVNTNGFIPVSHDLSAFAGQTVRLRFALIDLANFYSAALDNVRVDAPALP